MDSTYLWAYTFISLLLQLSCTKNVTSLSKLLFTMDLFRSLMEAAMKVVSVFQESLELLAIDCSFSSENMKCVSSVTVHSKSRLLFARYENNFNPWPAFTVQWITCLQGISYSRDFHVWWTMTSRYALEVIRCHRSCHIQHIRLPRQSVTLNITFWNKEFVNAAKVFNQLRGHWQYLV